MTHSKAAICATAVGLFLTSTPTYAQQFYAGGSILQTSLDSYSQSCNWNGSACDYSWVDYNDASDTGFAVFAGVRYNFTQDTPGGFYAGLEAQLTRTKGIDDAVGGYGDLENNMNYAQLEIHAGYEFQKFRVYGFMGKTNFSTKPTASWISPDDLSTVKGVGVEFDVTEKLAVRAELELSDIQIDYCTAVKVEKQDLSLGLVYKF